MYLSLEINPANVDVNVHPTKKEVHFLNEEGIVAAITQAFETQLQGANTSRTFLTQTLLPGASAIPTPDTSTSSTSKSNPSSSSTDKTSPTKAPYASQMVRTDNRSRTIDAFMQKADPASTAQQDAPKSAPKKRLLEEQGSRDNGDDDDDIFQAVGPKIRMATEQDRQEGQKRHKPDLPSAGSKSWKEVKLSSVINLRDEVQNEGHSGMQELFRDHSFVGCVDDRLALIQFQTKLCIVDYLEMSKELFYQLALREFSNFGVISLSTPAPVEQLILIALDGDCGWTADDGPKEEIAKYITSTLKEKTPMLKEYFMMEVSEEGNLLSLPLVLKGYLPNLDKLPLFLLRLGTEVDWNSEQSCFDVFCRELALFYAATAPIPDPAVHNDSNNGSTSEPGPGDDTSAAGEPASLKRAVSAAGSFASQEQFQFRWTVEHVLFPALRYYLVPPKRLVSSGDILQIADLPDLYKVFERC